MSINLGLGRQFVLDIHHHGHVLPIFDLMQFLIHHSTQYLISRLVLSLDPLASHRLMKKQVTKFWKLNRNIMR